ncbi:MAG: DUF1385 domain-containing protein [candidate division Zixibacteria bacterium]|nr:DUF1385 domain-containing protein [candidate division Zixibacteria bacterium]
MGQENFNVGGQAVIEGVMMRSAKRISTAVRIPDGSVRVKTDDYISISQRKKLFGLPFVRGVVMFLEMTVIGIKTLNFSAEVSIVETEKIEAAEKGKEYDESKHKKTNNFILALTVVFSLAIGIGIFFFLPLALSSWFGVERDALVFNLAAGAIRITFLVGYMLLLTLFADFKRIFEYHGAEHKTIFAYENGAELKPETVSQFTRFHPRCGTSFLLIVALFAVMVYSLSDTAFAVITGAAPELLQRFALHFSLLPVVAAVSYEILRFSGKTRNNPITRVFIQPGLWLQRITTSEPNHEQLEVAIFALEGALGLTESKISVTRIPESAVN